MDKEQFIRVGQRTVNIERDAIAALAGKIDDQFYLACKAILDCSGRVIVTGMGKSHHIGGKIAATLASTGTPAFFVHPGEASHGDLGMITKTDLVIAISYSGSSSEILMLLPLLKRMGVPLVSMTGNPNSPLARAADYRLNVAIDAEACPLDLAPTSSTTCALVMGDALAVALLEARGFTAEDFAFSHPGGALGRKLLVKVEDLMHRGAEIPQVNRDTLLPSALVVMTEKGLGLTTVVDEEGELIGIFTDGDLRRSVDHGVDINHASIGDVMTSKPKTVHKEMLAAEALGLMEDRKITALVVEEDHHPIGIIHMHDILRAGVL
ncbi:KpsF/GutQ family sugar-phosphate isomerase [Gilvimarinus sp. F26214L]|uniref:KpsF/GutQ family sugar-phosphate isomerase n=1 Tax=Gilvimarinus sp. DZF01 TaxID=3461371 RepID=UPI004045D007